MLINSEPWSLSLKSSLAELSPAVFNADVLQTLPLIHDPRKAFEFFNWAHEAGFSHDEHSLYAMMEILGRSGNLTKAKKLIFSVKKMSKGSVMPQARFFDSVIGSYGRAGLFEESLKLFGMMKACGVSPSVTTFDTLFSALLEFGRTSEVKRLYEEMLGTYGVTPDTHTFNILIEGCCMNSDFKVGFYYFRDMMRLGCDADIITYNALVDGLCRTGKVRAAYNFVKAMGGNSRELSPDVDTYRALIRGYCMQKQVDMALIVFKEMTSRGINPNTITYNTLLKGFLEAHKLDEVKEIFDGAMRSGEFIPDTDTFNALIHSHCKAGNHDKAVEVLDEMSELKVRQDSASYSLLICSLCENGEYDKAEELFDELSEREILLEDFSCRPFVASYGPMFRYLCGHGKTKKAERVFRQLLGRGVQDMPSYMDLINGNCREGSFADAHKLLMLMLRKGFEPDACIFMPLVTGLLNTGEPILAKTTMEIMLERKDCTSTLTFHSILAELIDHGFVKESASFFMLMLEKNIRQNMALSTKLILLLFINGLEDKALELIILLYQKGFLVNIEALVGFFCRTGKLLEACKLIHFSLAKNLVMDIELFDKVIMGLCNKELALEAFSLYYEIVEHGHHEDLTCLRDLKAALHVAGKSTEANFVYERMFGEKSQSIPKIRPWDVDESQVWYNLEKVRTRLQSHADESNLRMKNFGKKR